MSGWFLSFSLARQPNSKHLIDHRIDDVKDRAVPRSCPSVDEIQHAPIFAPSHFSVLLL
jgi:hypothetical protein